ncbi:uncharacterized protein PEZ65_004934 [Lycodopsis pacificus]
MCVTASIQGQISKACASSSLCPATGSQTFSANLGISGAVTSAQCCNTDNCNTETRAFPAAQTDNALQCFTCDPMTSQSAQSVTTTTSDTCCFRLSMIHLLLGLIVFAVC